MDKVINVDVVTLGRIILAGMILSSLAVAFLAWRVVTQKPKSIPAGQFDASSYLLALLIFTAICAVSGIIGIAIRQSVAEVLGRWLEIFAWGFGIWACVVTIRAIVYVTFRRRPGKVPLEDES